VGAIVDFLIGRLYKYVAPGGAKERMSSAAGPPLWLELSELEYEFRPEPGVLSRCDKTSPRQRATLGTRRATSGKSTALLNAALWSAPAERSGDAATALCLEGSFGPTFNFGPSSQSGGGASLFPRTPQRAAWSTLRNREHATFFANFFTASLRQGGAILL
jgi:hypothetical protein